MSAAARKILLIGNANTGKTTLFNAMTGSFRKTGNYFGVTVDEGTALLRLRGVSAEIKDLPGVVSLNRAVGEALVTKAAVEHGGYNAVIYVCSAVSLSRNLCLLDELKRAGINNITLAVNMCDEAAAKGIVIDYVRLGKALGVEVVAVSAKRKTNINLLTECVMRAADKGAQGAVRLGGGLSADKEVSRITDLYRRMDTVVADCVTYTRPIKKGLRGFDKAALSGVWGGIIFVLITAVLFWTVFATVAPVISEWLGGLTDRLAGNVEAALSRRGAAIWLAALITQGVIGGVGSVMEFLPQVVLLYLLIGLLEDVGYMSRAAYVTDGAMCKLGLKGRSTYTLAMGFGCTAAAVSTARAIDDEGVRVRTVMLTPLMSCSAKLPVFVVLAASFHAWAAAMAVTMYLGGVLIFVLAAKLMRPKCTDNSVTAIEIPPYRLPSVTRIIRLAGHNILGFVLRIGTFVLAVNIVVWLLGHFSLVWGYVPSGEGSFMHTSVSVITPLFAPLGLGDWRIVSSLVSGLAAKEAVISSLEALGGVTVLITEARQAVVMMVFVLLYTPCFAAVAATAREVGWRRAALSALIYLAGAYLAALIVNTVWGLFTHPSVNGIIIMSAALVVLLLIRVTTANADKCGGACKGKCWR